MMLAPELAEVHKRPEGATIMGLREAIIDRLDRSEDGWDFVARMFGWGQDRHAGHGTPADIRVTWRGRHVIVERPDLACCWDGLRWWKGRLITRDAVERLLGVLPGWLSGFEVAIGALREPEAPPQPYTPPPMPASERKRVAAELATAAEVAKAAAKVYEREGWLAVDMTGPGVYRLLSQGGRVLYVGQSVNVAARVGQHMQAKRVPFVTATWIPVAREDLTSVEAAEIEKWLPPYNGTGPHRAGRNRRARGPDEGCSRSPSAQG